MSPTVLAVGRLEKNEHSVAFAQKTLKAQGSRILEAQESPKPKMSLYFIAFNEFVFYELVQSPEFM